MTYDEQNQNDKYLQEIVAMTPKSIKHEYMSSLQENIGLPA